MAKSDFDNVAWQHVDFSKLSAIDIRKLRDTLLGSYNEKTLRGILSDSAIAKPLLEGLAASDQKGMELLTDILSAPASQQLLWEKNKAYETVFTDCMYALPLSQRARVIVSGYDQLWEIFVRLDDQASYARWLNDLSPSELFSLMQVDAKIYAYSDDHSKNKVNCFDRLNKYQRANILTTTDFLNGLSPDETLHHKVKEWLDELSPEQLFVTMTVDNNLFGACYMGQAGFLAEWVDQLKPQDRISVLCTESVMDGFIIHGKADDVLLWIDEAGEAHQLDLLINLFYNQHDSMSNFKTEQSNRLICLVGKLDQESRDYLVMKRETKDQLAAMLQNAETQQAKTFFDGLSLEARAHVRKSLVDSSVDVGFLSDGSKTSISLTNS